MSSGLRNSNLKEPMTLAPAKKAKDKEPTHPPTKKEKKEKKKEINYEKKTTHIIFKIRDATRWITDFSVNSFPVIHTTDKPPASRGHTVVVIL